MPIEVGFWKVVGNKADRIEYSSIDTENKLENIIEKDISVLNEDLMLIGRQIRTSYGKIIDLLAIDQNGKISIIELKKNRTPREVVAQTLDYASWVQTISYKEIADIYKENIGKEFEEGFDEHFGTAPPEKINQEHDIIVVSAALDSETERIITYLSNNYNVPINAVFFRYFKDGNSEYLSRSWLIDPNEVEEKSTRTAASNKGEEWNGKDFVVNIDVADGISTWEDSIKYGFTSAGGGRWYSNSLNQLFPGARIFAMIPKKGYLGVGKVIEPSVPIKDFMVEKAGGGKVSILNVPLKCEGIKKFNPNDLDKTEYLVRIEWIKTVPEEKAFWVKGMRANQNSAFKLKSEYTLNKLLEHFGLEE